MLYFIYIKKSNCTKHELERRPHRQTVDDTAGVPIGEHPRNCVKGSKDRSTIRQPISK